jgi:hypothetical protein
MPTDQIVGYINSEYYSLIGREASYYFAGTYQCYVVTRCFHLRCRRYLQSDSGRKVDIWNVILTVTVVKEVHIYMCQILNGCSFNLQIRSIANCNKLWEINYC